MPLAAGTRLGPYEIQACIGAGGMGEVYRARDTRLNRVVAVKVLPDRVAADPVRRRRFEREARAVSALNHPHICALYDIGREVPSPEPALRPDGAKRRGENGAIDFLVMEHCDGETLADRLAKRSLRFKHVLGFAIEMAEAVDAAHSHGFTHRDLKPANIMLTGSGVKLLDFGLTGLPGSLLTAPTETTLADGTADPGLTADGLMPGTLRYMAPEQLEGSSVDARADIFALGAILYEMATGRKAFDGGSQAEITAAILEGDPPPISHMDFQGSTVSCAFERVVHKCLAKSPAERWQNAGDLATELRWIAEEDAQGAVAASARRGGAERLARTLVSICLLIAGITTVVLITADRRRSAAASAVIAFEVLPPEGTLLSATAAAPAVSPDGRYLAFLASGRGAARRLWLRPFDALEARELPGTEDAISPFWSGDSRTIGFFAQGKLKTISITGLAPIVVCDVNGTTNRSGTWNRDGVILMSAETARGQQVIQRVSASGGTPVPVTRLERQGADSRHVLPEWLPDGRHFLYLAHSGREHRSAVFLASLDSGSTKRLLEVHSQAVYAEPGFLLFRSGGVLLAQAFDAASGRLSGAPKVIAGDVGYNPVSGRGMFSVSQTGVVAYRPAAENQLVWLDRRGNVLSAIGIPGRDIDPAVSPDGARVAVSRFDPVTLTRNLWILDAREGTPFRLTFGRSWDIAPTWAPDASRVIYASGATTDPTRELYEQTISGSDSGHRLNALRGTPEDWAGHGPVIIYNYGGDLWILPEAGAPEPLFRSPAEERQGQISPDGKWIAYASNESGRYEVYVQPFPTGQGRWQVSAGGGGEPKWRRDVKELFYLAADQRLMAVPVKAQGSSFHSGRPTALFTTRADGAGNFRLVGRNQYIAAPDGQSFLINQLPIDTASRLMVIVNWIAALGR